MLYHNGKLYVPDLLQVKKKLARYYGIHHIFILISSHFYWVLMCLVIQNYVTQCHKCQENKAM